MVAGSTATPRRTGAAWYQALGDASVDGDGVAEPVVPGVVPGAGASWERGLESAPPSAGPTWGLGCGLVAVALGIGVLDAAGVGAGVPGAVVVGGGVGPGRGSLCFARP